MADTRVTRTQDDGSTVVVVEDGGVRERVVTVTARPGEGGVEMVRRAVDLATAGGAHVVSQEVLGVGAGVRDQVEQDRGPLPWPLTWLEDGAGSALAGAQVLSLEGAKVTPVTEGSRVVGCVWEQAGARWCRLGDLRPDDVKVPPAAQAQVVLERMESLLAGVGLGFRHVFRTWFYNDDILGWYVDFNRVRSDFFRRHGVLGGLVPASTGIGGRNHAGAALVAGLLAADRGPDVVVEPLPSPLQCPALDYGSSFSRAVEVRGSLGRRVLVSGTASIEPGGLTAHVGDAPGQVSLTLRVVEAILSSRGMGWGEVTRGIAYCRTHAAAQAWTAYRHARGLQHLPVVTTLNVVCRDDLLFELEVDAVAS
jgi:enamine deaminase RidA (YjgF/YER057c/UK114 family)